MVQMGVGGLQNRCVCVCVCGGSVCVCGGGGCWIAAAWGVGLWLMQAGVV
jgi:hypothetical protein